jgi:hypothetical protein
MYTSPDRLPLTARSPRRSSARTLDVCPPSVATRFRSAHRLASHLLRAGVYGISQQGGEEEEEGEEDDDDEEEEEEEEENFEHSRVARTLYHLVFRLHFDCLRECCSREDW